MCVVGKKLYFCNKYCNIYIELGRKIDFYFLLDFLLVLVIEGYLLISICYLGFNCNFGF